MDDPLIAATMLSISALIFGAWIYADSQDTGAWCGQYKVQGANSLYHSDIEQKFLIVPKYCACGHKKLFGKVSRVVMVHYRKEERPYVWILYFPKEMLDSEIRCFISANYRGFK